MIEPALEVTQEAPVVVEAAPEAASTEAPVVVEAAPQVDASTGVVGDPEVRTQDIQKNVASGAAVVAAQTGTMVGLVSARGGVTITLEENSRRVLQITTGPDGSFTLNNLPTGIYTITADAPGFLPARAVVGVRPGITMMMNPVALLPGDLNDDGIIDSKDVAVLNNAYNTGAANVPPGMDLNGDGFIGLADLNLLASYIGKFGPTFWQ